VILLLVGVASGAGMPCAISVNGHDSDQCARESPCHTISYALAMGCSDILVQTGVHTIEEVHPTSPSRFNHLDFSSKSMWIGHSHCMATPTRHRPRFSWGPSTIRHSM